jgi:hypothetical protein
LWARGVPVDSGSSFHLLIYKFLAAKTAQLSLLQNSIETAKCVKARLHRDPHRQVFVDGVGLQSCRKWRILIPALAAAESQITENNKPQGAKAQHDYVALAARLKSCPDTIYSQKVILQEAQIIGFASGCKKP